MSRMGRPNVFRPKDGGRVHGLLTKTGREKFEDHRGKLGKLAGKAPISDGDVVEYLARGVTDTKRQIRSSHDHEKARRAARKAR